MARKKLVLVTDANTQQLLREEERRRKEQARLHEEQRPKGRGLHTDEYRETKWPSKKRRSKARRTAIEEQR